VRVALYARVSMDEASEEDRRYQEPENQLTPLREWAASLGYEVAGEYVDRASGADPGRPRFRQLFKDAHLGKFKAILVWKLDRFSREGMMHTVSYLQELQRRGVAVRSQTESWLDTGKDNPMSELVLAVMAWSAANERRNISDRTKAGIARRRAIGQWRGGRPKKRVPPVSVDVEKQG
jgi:DNA invertase Pin-like site-specific DNA recombinase